MKKIIQVLQVIALVAFLVVSGFFLFGGFEQSNVGGTIWAGSVTNSSVSVPTGTSTQVVSANSGRQYLKLTNRDTNFVECSIGEDASASQGFMLEASGGSFEIYEENPFIQKIECRGDTATSVINVVEY